MPRKNNYEVRLVRLNWNEECKWGLRTGKDFEVTEKETFKGDKEEKAMYGIHSPLFATDWEDENAFAERYRCKCGNLIGRVYEGDVCSECNTEVKFRDVNFDIYGWIRLNGNHIIQPLYYKMLESLIGKSPFHEIIEYDKDTTRDGDIQDKKGKTPFKGIGLIEFKERYFEIIEYYGNKKKSTHADIIETLTSEVDSVFVEAIPVYSSVLRPVLIKDETFKYNDIDRKYSSIFTTSRLLYDEMDDIIPTKKKKKKKSREMERARVLNSIQRKVNALWELVFSRINKKEGHIRDQILGGRLNFSSRCVIIPDPTLKADEIKINYLAFLELFRYEIIAHLVKVSNITPNQASDEWQRATINFNPKIYEIMSYIVQKRKPKVIINRNPTINYGSLLLMKIVEVKREYKDDYTMSIPIQILSALNADFDGDILNIISLKTKEAAEEFDKAFNPRKNMFISRNDGLFNNEFNLLKDQLIGLYEFNNNI